MSRLASLLALILLTACATTAPPPNEPQPIRLRMTTNAGTMTLRLFPQVAPKTVAQFVTLARAGVYDGIYFYRLERNFVLQTATHFDRATPLTPQQQALIHPLVLEPSPVLHQRGVLSLARADADPNSGETSFSILLGDAPHLDGKYTIFGTIEKSEEVLREIETTRDSKAIGTDGVRLRIVKLEVI